MFNPISFCIGLRYTRAKRRTHFISFISAVSMAGMALGVAVLILVLSVLNGFDRELKTRILGTVPHAVLEFPEGRSDLEPIMQKLRNFPGIAGVAPLNQGEGLLVANGQTVSVAIVGVDPDQEKHVSILPNYMQTGEFNGLLNQRFSVILGAGIAASLNVHLNDYVTVLIPDSKITFAGIQPRLKRLKVAGIFEVGAQLDNQLIFVELADAARLFANNGRVAAIRIQFDNLFDAPKDIRFLAQSVSDSLGVSVRYHDWTRTQGNLFEAIQLEKTLIALLLTLIIAVAAFNIVSTLVMVVTDKQADIAILKTIGLSPKGVITIFMIQGSLVGLIGTMIGVIIGIPLALTITDIVKWFESIFGFYLFNPTAYFISDLPTQLLWSDVSLVVGLSMSLSVFATIYPAFKASKIIPAEVLNHER